MRLRHTALLSSLLLSVTAAAHAENWPQFRGPSASGVPSESRLPERWGPEQNIVWKAKVPGVAWSQPIVWGDKIFVTTAVTENQPKPSVGGGGGGGGRGGFGRGPGGPNREGRPRDGQPREEPGSEEGQKDEGRKEEGRKEDGAKSGDAPREERSADQPDRPRRSGGGIGGGGGGGRGFGGRSAAPPDAVYRWLVLCLDRNSGKVLWEQAAHEGKPTLAIHRTNTYASETPLTDGKRLYAYFGMTGLYAYDMDGKPLWNEQLGSFPMMMGWGTGSSPALHDGKLFVQCDNEQESFLVALDAATGDELWRAKREDRSGWSTPYVWKNNKRTELVTAGTSKMRAYDPATGTVLWELGGLRGRCSATPVGTDELLYVGVGGGGGGSGPLVAIKSDATGEMQLAEGKDTPGIAWSVPRSGPPMASPVVYQDCLYVLEQRGGIVGCYDAKTGESHYKKRIEGARGFTSSPWAHDGKIFCLDEDGQTFVIKAGPEFELLATNKLDDTFWSSVAVAGDRLLLHGVENLYCIGQ